MSEVRCEEWALTAGGWAYRCALSVGHIGKHDDRLFRCGHAAAISGPGASHTWPTLTCERDANHDGEHGTSGFAWREGGYAYLSIPIVRADPIDWEEATFPSVEPDVDTDVAALDAQVRAAVLNEAADALEGGLGVPGVPQNLWEFRQWLRIRATLAGHGLE